MGEFLHDRQFHLPLRFSGTDGSLTGFGGGLPRKEWLLAHEGRPVNQSLAL